MLIVILILGLFEFRTSLTADLVCPVVNCNPLKPSTYSSKICYLNNAALPNESATSVFTCPENQVCNMRNVYMFENGGFWLDKTKKLDYRSH